MGVTKSAPDLNKVKIIYSLGSGEKRAARQYVKAFVI
jgi:hypothetical protein